jgi:hypothetical protein
MLTGTDGQVKGKELVDTFRIKIWDRTEDDILYDNKMGEAHTADATDAIEGGNVVVHAKQTVLGRLGPAEIKKDLQDPPAGVWGSLRPRQLSRVP